MLDWHRAVQVSSAWLFSSRLLTRNRPYGLSVPYRKLFRGFEDILTKNGGRPHWAKAHSLRRDALRELYPKFDDFVSVLESVDPQGLFRNEYIQRHFFEKPVPERIFKLRPT